ncbi:Phenylacetate--CoA ligase [Desulfobacca acetoxidans DSM 11109]|uniref:Phenylacetate-coenzyme A ligase n=2 Tax=Desulfobacca acetoxidans TaxID=60893 RepID=F2NJM4_DESAR|nr:Phenylacetate--CoA ligase [Desulfobacca acetoxidans DSM 11109]
MFESQYEAMERAEIAQLQLERLQSTLQRVYRNVKFYRKKFDQAGLLPEDFQSLEDLGRLPFTTKEDLSNSYPYGMFAVPLREVVRIHSSSGSVGNPMVVGYTCRDLRNWARLAARMLAAAGVTKDDVVQITFNYGLMTGGFGVHYGAEVLGASVIPTGTGNTFRQVQIMRDYRTTTLVATPSYALVIADKCQEIGLDPKDLHLRVGFMGGEPWGEDRRREIEERLLLQAFDLYGLSEAMGPGVAGECEYRQGMHLNEDHFLPEIIDPVTTAPLQPGEIGELVITTLSKEAVPLIRFRTGDKCSLTYEPCPCGRTFARLSRILGRTDEVIIVKGVNIFPQRVGQILAALQGEAPVYQLVVGREGRQDYLEVRVEVRESIFFDRMVAQRQLINQLSHKLAQSIGVTPRVKLVEPNTIVRIGETSPLVIDQRG